VLGIACIAQIKITLQDRASKIFCSVSNFLAALIADVANALVGLQSFL
jgi:hypothetical protein